MGKSESISLSLSLSLSLPPSLLLIQCCVEEAALNILALTSRQITLHTTLVTCDKPQSKSKNLPYRRTNADPPPLPVRPFGRVSPQASRKNGKKNANGLLKQQENEALAKAWTDPELKKHLLLDLVLYDHAVSVHKKQMAQYGLSK